MIKTTDTVTGESYEQTRPIEDIGVVVIESQQVTLTSSLISSLLENKVALITCDNKHMPSGLMLPLEGNTLQSERFEAQVGASLPLKKQLWQQTVAAKIRNQASVLAIANNMEIGNMLIGHRKSEEGILIILKEEPRHIIGKTYLMAARDLSEGRREKNRIVFLIMDMPYFGLL